MKWNIQKRLLALVLAAGILSFLTLSGLSFYGMNIVRSELKEMGNDLGKAGANFTQSLIEHQIKETLGDLAKARSEFIKHETDLITDNVQLMADMMSRIAMHPNEYKPIKLLDPRFDNIKNFQPYVIYSPESYLNGMTPEKLPPELHREIDISANIGTTLISLAKSFSGYKSSFYIGSKKGYFICVSLFPEINGALNFEDAEIYNYDCRERPWYKMAINASGPVFSDLYINSGSGDDYQLIGCAAPYLDQNGIAGVVGMDISNSELYDVISNTSVGENGFSFVLTSKGTVIFSTRKRGQLVPRPDGRDMRLSTEKSLAEATKKMAAGESGLMPVVVDSEEYLLAFSPVGNGWSFGTLTLRKDIDTAAEAGRTYFLAQIDNFNSRIQREYLLTTFVSALIFIGLLYVLFPLSNKLAHRFVKPINELSDGVRDIASGNLDKKLDIHTGDEIEHLSVCFNAMTYELKSYMENLTKVTAEKERIATELNVATEIQNGMLPKDFPDRDDFELFATMTPAKEVGGDFYDFYFIDEKHLAITVADVSGKGIPAALFMVIAKTILNNFAVSTHNRDGLAEVVACANDKLCANNDAMMFVTAFIGVLDLDTGEFVYVNAGHNPPVIYHAEENHCDFLDVQKNFVLGPMDGILFVEQRTTFKPGDLIFLYTDGVTEALNVKDEEYLPDRLIAFMNKTDCTVDLHELLKNVRADVADHVGEAEQSDDITMFALRFKGKAD